MIKENDHRKIKNETFKKYTHTQNAHVTGHTRSDLELLGSNLLIILMVKWRLGEDKWTVQGHTIQSGDTLPVLVAYCQTCVLSATHQYTNYVQPCCAET